MIKEETTSGSRDIRWEWVIVREYKGRVTYSLRPVSISYVKYR